ncbi:MAG: transaldolase [Candidatus Dasytiphilus stammeri]
MNQLELLRKYTKIVADSGNINEIIRYHPTDATTNPSLILRVAILEKYQPLLKDAILYAQHLGGNKNIQLVNASDKFLINIGVEILKYIPGKVSTEIDARLSFNRFDCIAKARKLVHLYQDRGIPKSRILIKLASTWEGIEAAKQLETEGIHCNMTLLFSYIQAKACADAGAYLISPFVGRISDWYQKHTINYLKYDVTQDPGVNFVRNIYNFYKKNSYKTIVMGASFRNILQITALTGCDALTISPQFLEMLENLTVPLERNLQPGCTKIKYPRFAPKITESFFRCQYNQDIMAVEKLSEGIRKFSHDHHKLEQLLLDYF